MKSRGLMDRDYRELREIHEKYYKEEFPFPNFYDNFLLKFVIEDNHGKIVTGGGVRTITEVVLITDKDRNVKIRREALLQAMNLSVYTTNVNKFHQLHAFVEEDSNWSRHLKKVGFVDAKGQPLVFNI